MRSRILIPLKAEPVNRASLLAVDGCGIERRLLDDRVTRATPTACDSLDVSREDLFALYGVLPRQTEVMERPDPFGLFDVEPGLVPTRITAVAHLGVTLQPSVNTIVSSVTVPKSRASSYSRRARSSTQ